MKQKMFVKIWFDRIQAISFEAYPTATRMNVRDVR